MGRKLNYKTLCERFNKIKSEHKDDLLTREQAVELFHSIGINAGIAKALLRGGVLESEKISNKIFYRFRSGPLHKDQLESYYRKNNAYSAKYNARKRMEKQSSSIEDKPLVGANDQDITDALQILKNSGFRVQKARFDLELLKREEPSIYQKYLVYEEI